MSVVTTNFYTNIPLELAQVKELVCELPFDGHDFVVLAQSARDDADYVQTALEDEEADENSRYIVETQVWRGKNDFTHYRTFTDTAAQAYAFFEAFYQTGRCGCRAWEDVSGEFRD